jgi:hypothetical protein
MNIGVSKRYGVLACAAFVGMLAWGVVLAQSTSAPVISPSASSADTLTAPMGTGAGVHVCARRSRSVMGNREAHPLAPVRPR